MAYERDLDFDHPAIYERLVQDCVTFGELVLSVYVATTAKPSSEHFFGNILPNVCAKIKVLLEDIIEHSIEAEAA
jgi:hypothetical protein